MSSGDQHHRTESDCLEQQLKTRLSELTAKISDKEMSSGEEQDLELRMETGNSEMLSSEENSKCVQEEIKKV